jgi:hypothetical protein
MFLAQHRQVSPNSSRTIEVTGTSAMPIKARPALIFLFASLFIGLAGIAVSPPLRGPDESAHFLRAFAISRGELIPSVTDAMGRRGLFLSSRRHRQFAHFDQFREVRPDARLDFRDVFKGYFDQSSSAAADDTAPVFVPFEGAEAYSPLPYLPYAIAARIAQWVGLDFLLTIYGMRIAGLLAWTFICAWAIATVPRLKWMFFCAAMLPSALYQRSVISVDGAVLSTTLAVVALCLKASDSPVSGIARRALWMAISSLTKPPQIVLACLEILRSRSRDCNAQLWGLFLVSIPSIALSLSWIIFAGADVGAWRLREGNALPAQEFDPRWKLLFLLRHPLKFMTDVINSLDYSAELWKQLIGVFGWLDVPMRGLAYPVITALLVVTLFDELALSSRARCRIAIVSALTMLGYCLAVCTIFFVTLTPTEAGRIEGLQGRYFLVVLPLLGLTASAIVNRGLGRATALAALTSALVSAAAMLDALWRFHWAA